MSLRVPQRGDKRSLLETVERNAKDALARHKLKRAGDLTTRSQALDEIAESLGMRTSPLRIECFDVSQIQGTDVVASMVVFEDGLPRKSDYRHYAIKEAAGDGRSDDVASIAEVTRRRFLRHRRDVAGTEGAEGGDGGDFSTEAALDPATGKPRRFAYPPNLFVVDGGAPQVAAAAEVLDELGITDVSVIGLAKRLEEVWVPGESDPVILPRTSEGLYLLQRLRDEAHRFAITFHRQRRSKAMTTSQLDGIPGLGDSRQKALLKHFGSIAAIHAASDEQLLAVPNVNRRQVSALRAARPSGPPEPENEAETEVMSMTEPEAEGADTTPGIEKSDLSVI